MATNGCPQWRPGKDRRRNSFSQVFENIVYLALGLTFRKHLPSMYDHSTPDTLVLTS